MNNNKVKKIKNKEEKSLLSPSLYYYNLIEITAKEYTSNRLRYVNIKRKISQLMKYYFFFIDLVIISFILCKNTINMFSNGNYIDIILYSFLTLLVIRSIIYCIKKINSIIYKEKDIKLSKNLLEEIIEIKGFIAKNDDCFTVKIKKSFKTFLINITMKYKVILWIGMITIGLFSLQNTCFTFIISSIIVYYYLMRPVHYILVFYKDFNNKMRKGSVRTSQNKLRYILLAISNYIKIILEFCILIYVLKYMGWAFVNIEINTFFELVNLVVSGDLRATTSSEILVNLLMISSLGMVITLNLATYMGLEVRAKKRR